MVRVVAADSNTVLVVVVIVLELVLEEVVGHKVVVMRLGVVEFPKKKVALVVNVGLLVDSF